MNLDLILSQNKCSIWTDKDNLDRHYNACYLRVLNSILTITEAGMRMRVLILVTVSLHLSQGLGETRQCLADGEYCYSGEECCAGVCSHHWPPTTTPVFGQERPHLNHLGNQCIVIPPLALVYSYPSPIPSACCKSLVRDWWIKSPSLDKVSRPSTPPL